MLLKVAKKALQRAWRMGMLKTLETHLVGYLVERKAEMTVATKDVQLK